MKFLSTIKTEITHIETSGIISFVESSWKGDVVSCFLLKANDWAIMEGSNLYE